MTARRFWIGWGAMVVAVNVAAAFTGWLTSPMTTIGAAMGGACLFGWLVSEDRR